MTFINRKPHIAHTRLLRISLAIFCLLLLLSAGAASASANQKYLDEEVVVKFRGSTTKSDRRSIIASISAKDVSISPTTGTWTLKLGPGIDTGEAVEKLATNPSVAYAVPNAKASAAVSDPDDPGFGAPMDWKQLQWNFLETAGINTPAAWSTLDALGKGGAKGVKIAVIDTGVAYRKMKGYRKAPDLKNTSFLRGYDFVADDPYPVDENGHGTHVTGTIAQSTNNGQGVTGVAYKARIIPVRALNFAGTGGADDVAAAIRYAAKRGAQIINLSVEFDASLSAKHIPQVLSAIRFAHRKRVLIVAASGNFALTKSALPARAAHVVAVGATTENLCLGDYSNLQPDLVAPGGGSDRVIAEDERCTIKKSGRGIYQQTFKGKPTRFSLLAEVGTSAAAPHVSATAAMVIASGKLGKRPSPAAIEEHLKNTAVDLGPPGFDQYYGAGIVNAAAAVAQ